MARIVGIDYGMKRTGVSATDPLQIIVSGIDTVATSDFIDYMVTYCREEPVEKIVFGRPQHKDGVDTYLVEHIEKAIVKLSKALPEMTFDWADESYSSTDAKHAILMSGAKKSKRRDKALVDKISAVIILQRYLGHI